MNQHKQQAYHNDRPCRTHCFIGGYDSRGSRGNCILCGAHSYEADHFWCIQDWHRCWDGGGKGYGW